jgi:DNA-binding NarL/FixJ family response regulator
MALKYISPWNLTPRQADVMDAMVEHGCHKLAGRALGIDEDTVMQHIWMANKKMGFHSGHLVKYIQWDRWRRSEKLEDQWRIAHDEHCTNMQNRTSFSGTKKCQHPRP